MKVLRNAAAYLGISWGLVEAVDYLTARYGLPPRTVDRLLALLVACLPAILYLSWRYEPEEERTPSRRELAGAGVSALVLLLLLWLWGPTQPAPVAEPTPAPIPAAPYQQPATVTLKSGREAGDLVTSDIGMKLAWVPPGSFLMGSASADAESYGDQMPRHRVKIRRGFYMGIHEVTQAVYKSVVGKNPSRFPGKLRPVENVKHADAVAFCEQLTAIERRTGALPADWMYRLPSEAEWEYACRAGTETTRYREPAEAIAWCAPASGGKTRDVGGLAPNAWGLHDMLGNVWEWTLDEWHPSYRGAPLDERPWVDGASALHVLRGGAWKYPAEVAQSASRGRPLKGFQYSTAGFRCVLARTGE